MREKIQGSRLSDEGWGGFQGSQSRIGQQFRGLLQESWSVCMLYTLQRTPMSASPLTPCTPPCKTEVVAGKTTTTTRARKVPKESLPALSSSLISLPARCNTSTSDSLYTS